MSDMISREAAIDAATSCPDSHWGPWIAKAIRALPAVQPDAREAALREALKGLMAHEPDYSDTLWQDARAALKEIKP